MAKPDETRPLALVFNRAPWAPDDKLANVLREDLTELLQFVKLRVQEARDSATAAQAVANHTAPALVCFSDVPGLPPDCIEGAVEMLEEYDIVLGPTADSGVYLLALSETLDPDTIESLINAAAGAEGLVGCIALCEEAQLTAGALPPWFRIGNAKDLSFAENLTRLSLLSEDGDMDFFADRLRLWFENRSKS